MTSIPRSFRSLRSPVPFGPGPKDQGWIGTVEKANEEFFEELEGDPQANFRSMAWRLVEVFQVERETTRERLEMLENLLAW